MIVIHFGLRKAGSSSIQRFLKSNQADLRALGYDYAPIGHKDGRSHLNLAYEVQKSDRFDPSDGALENIRRYWRLNRGKILIISSEIFEETPKEGIKFLKSRLSRVDDDFRPLMIVRDLVNLIVSTYSQHAKMPGSVADFDKYCAEFLQRPRADFYDTAQRWAKIFGWETIRVRLLDREFLLNGDLIDDFVATAGLEIGAEEAIGLKRPREVNTSPGWRVAEALRALYDGRHGLPNDHPLLGNRQGEGDHVTPVRSYAEQLGDKWGWNADKGRYLTTEQAQACLDIYERSVDALNLHLTSKLPRPKTLKQRGFISRDFLPDASLIPADDLRQFYDELGNLAQTLRRPSRRSSR